MKLMLTTFVIPFAFVYYPSLMSFPNLKWEVLVPVITCLLLQWTVSVTCYGYFRRDLGTIERLLFGVIPLPVRRTLRPRHLLEPFVRGDAACDVRLHLLVEQGAKTSSGRAPHNRQTAAQAFR